MRHLLASALLAGLVGCASYTVPGGPAEMPALGAAKVDQAINTDPNLRAYYDAKPLANFPAMLATARVQSANYQSRTASAYGGDRYGGEFSVITTRDVESDDAIARLNKLPMVAGVAPLNRLLLSSSLKGDQDLRDAAARLKADVLVLYTFDTQFYVKDFAAPVTVVTLGLSPNKKAYVTTTATAVLLDVRSGYVYGGAEATAKSEQLSNGWTSDDAVDDTRLRTERQSFDKLVGELEKTWKSVVATYAMPSTRPAAE